MAFTRLRRARFYDPAVARWWTMDPADEFQSPYCYVGNNPTNLVDPDGRQVNAKLESLAKMREVNKLPDNGSMECYQAALQDGEIVGAIATGIICASLYGGVYLWETTPVLLTWAMTNPDKVNQFGIDVLEAISGIPTTGTFVFYSGGTKATAQKLAKEIGGFTLDMTPAGKMLDEAIEGYSYAEARELIDAFSGSFAQAAKGDVYVVLNSKKLTTGSTWLKVEKPILEVSPDVNIIYKYVDE